MRIQLPDCEDMSHSYDNDPTPEAMALVPLCTDADSQPYAWMQVCGDCFIGWRNDTPWNARQTYLRLVQAP